MATKPRNKTNAVEGLSAFEGRDVVGSRIAIKNAGDGLTQALSIEPQEFHHDEEVTVVLRCIVRQVNYVEAAKDSGVLNRVHSLSTVLATIVDGDIVKEVLDAQELKIEQAKGVERLDFDAPGEGDDDGNSE